MSGRFNLNDYVTVDERIDRFWEQYPGGAIRTEVIYTNNDGSSVAIRASVYKDWEHPTANPDATGIAQELQGGANANKASWWENCETSAIGRALANLGMSISKQRPSREEMAKVRRYEDAQDAPAAPSAPQRPTPASPGLAQAQRTVARVLGPASAPPAAGVTRPVDWNQVWPEARAQGINNSEQLIAFLGKRPDELGTAAILAKLRDEPVPVPASHAG